MSWQSLATIEAKSQGIQTDIVLATIEAETSGRNETNDSGRALGYGSVWPLWHMDCFNYAAKKLGLSPPPEDLPSLTTYTLGNDQFSMAMTVQCIKQYWTQANGDWNKFTKTYVGPSIPQWDFDRRKKIWDKYRNPNAASTVDSSSVNSNNVITNSNNQLYETNYGVVNNSVKYGNIIFGRRYRVIVSDTSGQNALDVSELKCVFSVSKTMQQEANYSEVAIYNLAPNTENAIIKEGMRVIVEAGYEGEQYGVVFDGDVIQPIKEREDAVTKKLTLISLDGDRFMVNGFVNYSMYRGQTPLNVIQTCANKATVPSQLGSISTELSRAPLSRGKVYFGLANDILRQVAQSEKATYYIDHNKVNIIKAADLPTGEVIKLTPKSGLIGVPTQTEYGLKIKCALNPKIKLNTFVQVDSDLVKLNQVEIGKVQQPLDSAGLYRVLTVTHIGDTRGDDWYTEIDTVTQSGKLPSMITNGGASPW